MLFTGLDLKREPLDLAMPHRLQGQLAEQGCMSIVKGFTRASSLGLILLVVSDLDVDDQGTWATLTPLFPILDNASLLPSTVCPPQMRRVLRCLHYHWPDARSDSI